MEVTAERLTPTSEPPQSPAASDTLLRPESKRRSIKAKLDHRRALYLDEGQVHTVWKPKRVIRPVSSKTIFELEKHKQDLQERQQKLLSRVQATREVMKVKREELVTLEEDEMEEEEEEESVRFNTQRQMSDKGHRVITKRGNLEVKKKERRNRKRQSTYFHNVVSQYVAAMTKTSPNRDSAHIPTSLNPFRNRISSSPSLKEATLHTGVMPLRQWKSLMFDDHRILDTRQKHASQTFEDTKVVNKRDTVMSEDFSATPTTNTTSDTMGEDTQPCITFTLSSEECSKL